MKNEHPSPSPGFQPRGLFFSHGQELATGHIEELLKVVSDHETFDETF